MRQRACVRHMGPAAWVLCRVDTLWCCSSGPAQMMTSHTDVFRNISRNTEKNISRFHTQGFDFWGTKSHHWHQIRYRGFTPRPHWRTSQTPLLHARPVFRGGLRWLNPRSLHKNFWSAYTVNCFWTSGNILPVLGISYSTFVAPPIVIPRPKTNDHALSIWRHLHSREIAENCFVLWKISWRMSCRMISFMPKEQRRRVLRRWYVSKSPKLLNGYWR